MSGSAGDMGSLLQQAQKMQRDLDRARAELRELRVEGTAGGGAVRVVVSGDRQVLGVHIADEVARAGDRGMLEDLVTAAVRDALGRAHQAALARMKQVTGGVDLPGFF